MRRIIFTLSFLVFTLAVHSQTELDSLLAELPKAQKDTNYVVLLTKLSKKFAKINPEEGILKGRAAVNAAQKLGWKKGAALASQMIGYNHSRIGRYDSAIFYYVQSSSQAETIGLTKISALNSVAIGLVLVDKGEYKKAIKEYNKALSMSQEVSDYKTTAKALRYKAEVHLKMDQYNEALDTYRELQRFCNEADLPSYLIRAYKGMNSTYQDLSNYSKSLEYALKARDLYEEQGNRSGMAKMETSIAVIFQEQLHYEEALEHYNKALTLDTESEDHYSIALGLNNIGSVHHSLAEYDQAFGYYERALEEFNLANDPEGSAFAIYNMGAIHKSKGDYEKAFELLKRSRGLFLKYGDLANGANSKGEIGNVYQRIAESNNAQVLQKFSISSSQTAFKTALTYTDSAVQQLRVEEDIWNLKYYLAQKSNIDEALGNNKSALESYKEYTLLNDSIFNLEKDKKLVQTDLKYGFAIRENELEQQRLREAAIAKAEVQRQRTIRNSSLIGAGVVLFFAIALFRQRNRIKREKQRSEVLLLNILPAEVAEELKEKGHSDAQLIDHVTVLFTDFKGFTALSEKVTPKELVEDLHQCFSAFDGICEKYGIEKIKTIGDAYMAAGGLPIPNTTHAKDVTLAALEMAQVVKEGKSKKQAAGQPFFEIRIGIHTGPVVAGIVGVKKFAYDIWGDTVNTASRMESSGSIGKVNISETTYMLLKDDGYFSFESRGKIEAKGKGEMEMYFVRQGSEGA